MGAVEALNNENIQSQVSHMLSWITSKAESITRHHLEGFVAAFIIIFTCFYIYWNRSYGRKKVGNYHRSHSFAALHGGQLAVQRMLDAQNARIDPSALDSAEKQLKKLLANSNKLRFSQLQSVVAKLEMSGKEQKAVEILSEALHKANQEGRHHEAYELDMLIVETLIFQGEYNEAWKRNCLKDKDITDARRPLYKTVILTIQDQEQDKAREYWNEFKAIRSQFQWPGYFHDASVDAATHDFDMFKERVRILRKDIDIHKNNAK